MKIITLTLQLTLTSALTLLTHTVYSQGSGYALDFDGTSDYINCEGFSSMTAYTIEGWFKADTDANQNLVVATNAIGPTSLFSHQIRIENQRFAHYIWDGSPKTIFADNIIETDRWYHIAITASNSGQINMYVDGILQSSSIPVGTMWAGLDRFHLGSNAVGSLLDNYNGVIDEVRIWNIVRSNSEIQEDMCQKLNGSEPNLVAYYRMDEGIDNSCAGGEDVCDLTGNGNHGTKF